jgi:chaperonin cofactor prefoldin
MRDIPLKSSLIKKHQGFIFFKNSSEEIIMELKKRLGSYEFS